MQYIKGRRLKIETYISYRHHIYLPCYDETWYFQLVMILSGTAYEYTHSGLCPA